MRNRRRNALAWRISYNAVSQAIYKNVNEALSGQMEPQAALKKASGEIDKALATF